MKQSNYSFWSLTKYFLKLGAVGFGGPIALVEHMRSDLVEQKNWLTQEEYSRGLALSQLSPGPLAAQLAIYIGYIKNKVLGATIIGLAFVLPSFIMVVILGWLYKTYGSLSWMQALFYGIGAAIIAIIAKSSYKLTKNTCGNKKLLWAIFLVIFIATALTGKESVWLLLLGGFIAMFANNIKFINQNTKTLATFALPQILQNSKHVQNLKNIFLFFAKAGFFVFGSGLAIVPFLHSGVIDQYHWLNQRQFLDAVAVAMITPGPVVITVGFIGYLVEGFIGALVAAFAIFFPIWLIIVVATPSYEKFAKNEKVKSFVSGITAATCGAIAGAVIILGRTSISNIPTAIIGLVSLGLLIKFKIPEPLLIAGAGITGLILVHFR
jgi:chromate transporter